MAYSRKRAVAVALFRPAKAADRFVTFEQPSVSCGNNLTQERWPCVYQCVFQSFKQWSDKSAQDGTAALQMGALRPCRLRAIRRKWKYTIVLIALRGVFWLTAGPRCVASDQQRTTQITAHTLSTSPIPWHPPHHARLTHAGMHIFAFQYHWADARLYKWRQNHYLAEPHIQPACTAWSANSFLALSLLHMFPRSTNPNASTGWSCLASPVHRLQYVETDQEP